MWYPAQVSQKPRLKHARAMEAPLSLGRWRKQQSHVCVCKANQPTSNFHDITRHDVAGFDPLHCLPVLPVHFAHLGLVLLERLDGIFSIAFLLRFKWNSYQTFLKWTNHVSTVGAWLSYPWYQCISYRSPPLETQIHSQTFPLLLLIDHFNSSSGHSTTIFGCVLTT